MGVDFSSFCSLGRLYGQKGKTDKRLEGKRETRSEEKTEKQNWSRLCFQRNATNELSLLQSGHFEKRKI
jgi:hypothetical protein